MGATGDAARGFALSAHARARDVAWGANTTGSDIMAVPVKRPPMSLFTHERPGQHRDAQRSVPQECPAARKGLSAAALQATRDGGLEIVGLFEASGRPQATPDVGGPSRPGFHRTRLTSTGGAASERALEGRRCQPQRHQRQAGDPGRATARRPPPPPRLESEDVVCHRSDTHGVRGPTAESVRVGSRRGLCPTPHVTAPRRRASGPC